MSAARHLPDAALAEVSGRKICYLRASPQWRHRDKESNHGQGTATQQQGEEKTEAAKETCCAHDAGTTPREVIVARGRRACAATPALGDRHIGGCAAVCGQREPIIFLDLAPDWPASGLSFSEV